LLIFLIVIIFEMPNHILFYTNKVYNFVTVFFYDPKKCFINCLPLLDSSLPSTLDVQGLA